jgi:hypothetical protein
VDTCSNGACTNTPNNTLCPQGQTCNATQGCVVSAQCDEDADCVDAYSCTVNVCSGGECILFKNNGLCAANQVCDPQNGGAPPTGCKSVAQCSMDSQCGDGVLCTVDVCSGGSCLHNPNNALCNANQTCSATLGCQTNQVCAPNTTASCTFNCAVSAQNIPGVQVCNAMGSGYGACSPAVASEVGFCADNLNNDCDGNGMDAADPDCQVGGLICQNIATKHRARIMSGVANADYTICGSMEGLNSCNAVGWGCSSKKADNTGFVEWTISSNLGCDIFQIWKGKPDQNGNIDIAGNVPLVQASGNTVAFASGYSFANFEFAKIDGNNNPVLYLEANPDLNVKTVATGYVMIAMAGGGVVAPNFATETCAVNP